MPVANQSLGRRLLGSDPTRTTTIRLQFISEIRRRFRKLRRSLRKFLVEEDELGLKPKTSLMRLQRRFEFLSDPEKVTAFNEWFLQQVQADVLSVSEGADPTRPWTAKYVESAYRRGQVNSFISSRQSDLADELGVGGQTQEAFLQSAFNQPETVNKVRLLATRSFEQLKGVTAQMGSDMNRILAQGIADGRGVVELAREMHNSIRGIERRRALVIARTEVIHAHAEGQLDAFEELGVKELGVRAEWSTAGDDRVCPQCASLEGKVFDLDESRGLIPFHPQCRCAWIPSEPKAKKTGTKAALQRAEKLSSRRRSA